MLDASDQSIHILLVEDNSGDVILINLVLEKSSMPYTLHRVQDGEEALQYLRQEESYTTAPCPDLLLLDLNLPKINGHEVLSTIKADSRLKLIPVVVLTGSLNPNDFKLISSNDLTCCLSKPSGLKSHGETMQAIEEFLYSAVKSTKDSKTADSSMAEQF